MKPLYHALAVGLLIALFHVLVLAYSWTLWDVSIVSISGLSAGVFFVLGMIFRSTVQDYKTADIAIAQMRGKILSMQDINSIAAQEVPSYDGTPFRLALARAAERLRDYIENDASLDEANTAVSALIATSQHMRKALPGAQANLFLKQHEDVRQSLSYLAYLKHHNFPLAGYAFLWFFAAFIIVLQLFSETQNLLLDTLFIFSLSAILIFFIEFIRDLEHPFRCHLACFTLDTRPLKYTAAVLRGSRREPNEPLPAPFWARKQLSFPLWR
ncbi:MAG: hypothetical protein PHO92_04580 [Candidatus Peribacteraceae bacterium]|nr:hypothetical protein [Candidatus Peribacteraceae bacterium]